MISFTAMDSSENVARWLRLPDVQVSHRFFGDPLITVNEGGKTRIFDLEQLALDVLRNNAVSELAAEERSHISRLAAQVVRLYALSDQEIVNAHWITQVFFQIRKAISSIVGCFCETPRQQVSALHQHAIHVLEDLAQERGDSSIDAAAWLLSSPPEDS